MRNDKASVLIEVLLSIVILGVVLTFVMQSLLTSYRGVMVNFDYSRALFLLEDHSLQLMQQGFLTVAQEQGVYDQFGKRFGYRMTSDKGSDKGPIHNVELKVFWKSGNKERSVNFETFLFKKDVHKDEEQ